MRYVVFMSRSPKFISLKLLLLVSGQGFAASLFFDMLLHCYLVYILSDPEKSNAQRFLR